jgi:large subunit ribosomal protein L20
MPLHKSKILKMAKGFRGRAKNCQTIARRRVEKGLLYAYRDRHNKKRDIRALWIQQLNAGVRLHGANYSQFMDCYTRSGIRIDRKILAELARNEPYSFKAVVDEVLSFKDAPSIASLPNPSKVITITKKYI